MKFEVYEVVTPLRSERWRWRVIALNGRIVAASSEGFFSKEGAEDLLLAALNASIADLPDDQQIMLKLTLPTVPNLYADLVTNPKVLRVVALSGGYSRAEADRLLRENHGVVASFSRALTEGLTAQQSDEEFNAMLDNSIQSIYDASLT